MKKKIVIAYEGTGDWLCGLAFDGVAEDGKLNCIASHICSSDSFVKHDMGIMSNWKHDIYNERYPDGWELVWVGHIDRDDIDRIKEILSETAHIKPVSERAEFASVKIEHT